MPELPEVETMVRGVRDVLVGAKILRLSPCPCRCRPLAIHPGLAEIQEAVAGRRVSSVSRRAKRIVVSLETGHAIVIEPRMTGLMLVSDPPDREHLRLEWVLSHGRTRRRVWYWDRRGLGTVSLLTPDQLSELLTGDRLGCDALDMTADQWREVLGKAKRPVKVALLDQKLVAGIGNLYASEILHRAGIHPAATASRLSKARVERIHAATQLILHEAIRYEGSTLGDGTYRNALNQDGGYQNKHAVYAKHGMLCPTCGRGEIKRIVQAQRSTFFCGNCQRR